MSLLKRSIWHIGSSYLVKVVISSNSSQNVILLSNKTTPENERLKWSQCFNDKFWRSQTYAPLITLPIFLMLSLCCDRVVTMCYWYLVAAHHISDRAFAILPTRYPVARFLLGSQGGRYPVLNSVRCSNVQLSLHWGLDNSNYMMTVIVTVPSRWLIE